MGRTIGETWLDDCGDVEHELTFGYNYLNQQTVASDSVAEHRYTSFDERGRLLQMSMVGIEDVADVSFTYQYDQEDAEGRYNTREIRVDGQVDSKEWTYFDEVGRVISRRQDGSVDARVDFTYTDLGQFDSLTRYAGLTTANQVNVTDYQFDDLDRLSVIDHGSVQYGYDYDRFNRIESFTTGSGLSSYGYDGFSQLQVADNPGNDDEAYQYDSNGNRTAEVGYQTTKPNLVESDGTYRYEYDAEGNRTLKEDLQSGEKTTYEWDHRGRLIAVTTESAGGVLLNQVEYAYDVFDRLVIRNADMNGDGTFEDNTRALHQGDHAVLFFDDNGTATHRLFYGPQLDQMLAQIKIATSEVRWILGDHLNTVRNLLNSQGQIRGKRGQAR